MLTWSSIGHAPLTCRSHFSLSCPQLTILERAVKRTQPPAAQGGAGGAGSPRSAQPASHAFDPHIDWSLTVVAQLLYSMHSLRAPQMQSLIAPISGVFEMDSVEKAMTLGEDVDLVKQQRETVSIAGTVASFICG